MLKNRSVSACMVVCLVVALFLALSSGANADPPSWSSFEMALFIDVYVTPPLTTGILDYVLSMGSVPEILLGGMLYDINWIQAYFVISQDQMTGFIATNGTAVTDWIWEEKSMPGRIAGWHGLGSNRIYPDGSKQLGFGSFDITGNDVLHGFHVGYQDDDVELTGWYKGPLASPQIPEPGSWIALLSGTIALFGLRRRTQS